MYDKYYIRKKEIADNVLLIIICDVECDTPSEKKSTFNIGQVDMLFDDFQNNFKSIEDDINEISK